MTAKRDFKRRVRDRQARTGETYTTARRHVRAAQPAKADAVDVTQVRDVSAEAARLGYRCRVAIYPTVLDRAELAVVLARLRDALVGGPGTPATVWLFGLAFGVAMPTRTRTPSLHSVDRLRELVLRARAGLHGVTEDGTMLAFPVTGDRGISVVLCTTWDEGRALLIAPVDDLFAVVPGAVARIGRSSEAPLALPPLRLFVIYDGHRHPVTSDAFVIGRDRRSADLAIRDGMVSRRHAAVICRDGVYFLSDLGSTHGILYRGVRIVQQRIDEDDVFHIGGHELRFTFVAGD